MTDFSDTDVIATISASPPRRWLGICAMYILSGLLFYIAFSAPPELIWLVFLLVTGAATLWLAEGMRRATARTLELTRLELRDTSGNVLAYVADIEAIDRGFFAFKPSNGFLIRTSKPAGPNTWQPGMWWRVGRQLGVGGVTSGQHTKPMSEIISVMIAQNNGDLPKDL